MNGCSCICSFCSTCCRVEAVAVERIAAAVVAVAEEGRLHL